MELVLKLSKTQHALLAALAPRLQEDVTRLTECESAYEVEVARKYDFAPASPEESQSTERESELAVQTA